MQKTLAAWVLVNNGIKSARQNRHTHTRTTHHALGERPKTGIGVLRWLKGAKQISLPGPRDRTVNPDHCPLALALGCSAVSFNRNEAKGSCPVRPAGRTERRLEKWCFPFFHSTFYPPRSRSARTSCIDEWFNLFKICGFRLRRSLRTIDSATLRPGSMYREAWCIANVCPFSSDWPTGTKVRDVLIPSVVFRARVWSVAMRLLAGSVV